MASLPSSSDKLLWGTKYNAFLNVGHDSDGTHTKSQMLTDMEWSPTTYAGEESITFPNGLILKMGQVNDATGSGTVTFGVTFPTNVISIVTTPIGDVAHMEQYQVNTFNKDGFTWLHNIVANISGFFWQVWGY